MNARQLISNHNFAMTCLPLAKELGVIEAFLLGQLCNESDLWETLGKLTDDGFFFCTIERIKDKTGLTAYQQRTALAKLEDAELLTVHHTGMPQKRYIRLNDNKINEYLNKIDDAKNRQTESENISLLIAENRQTRSENFSQQEVKNFNTNKIVEKIKDNSIKDKSLIEAKQDSAKPLKPKKQSYKDVIDELITDENAKAIVYEYANTIKETRGYPLPVKQLRTKIEETLQLTNGNIEYFIEIFKNANDNCYVKLVDTRKNNYNNYKRPEQNSLDDWFAELDAAARG